MRLRERIEAGEPLIGCFVRAPDPQLIEVAGHAGMDFVIADMEHGPYDWAAVEGILRAASAAGTAGVVRIEGAESSSMTKVLDSGAEAIIVPHVETVADATQAFRRSRFPPEGSRAASPSARAARYSAVSWSEYRASREFRPMLWFLVETRAGVAALPHLLEAGRPDVVFVGLFDLALDVGVEPPSAQGLHPELEGLLARAVAICRASGVPVASWANLPDLRRWAEAGVQIFYQGTDVAIMMTAYRDLRGRWKDRLRPAG